MILEVDLGNTRCKWRLRNGKDSVARGSLFISEPFNALASDLEGFRSQIKYVWVASVIEPELEQAFIQWSVDYLSITPGFARTTDICMGVINGYREPHRLGVDRWLGMVACFQRIQKAFLLVSFGTAVTVDIVLENGRHAGGFIAPGLNLMLDSLQQKTHQVKADRHWERLSLLPGASTTDAVYAAVTAMLVGLIENGLTQSRNLAPHAEFDVIFAGGDAHKMLPFYPRAQYMPELVLDGLAYILDNSR